MLKVRYKKIYMGLVGVVCLVISLRSFASDPEPFEYGGLSLETNRTDFVKKYPTSTIDKRDKSQVQVWISKKDSHDHIYFLRKTSNEIKISLEKPAEFLEEKAKSWEEGHFLRHISCDDVLDQLLRKYGGPSKEEKSREELLYHRNRTWSGFTETMTLDCYSLNGLRDFLANEITIKAKP